MEKEQIYITKEQKKGLHNLAKKRAKVKGSWWISRERNEIIREAIDNILEVNK